jgi:hypothetical protein
MPGMLIPPTVFARKDRTVYVVDELEYIGICIMPIECEVKKPSVDTASCTKPVNHPMIEGNTETEALEIAVSRASEAAMLTGCLRSWRTCSFFMTGYCGHILLRCKQLNPSDGPNTACAGVKQSAAVSPHYQTSQVNPLYLTINEIHFDRKSFIHPECEQKAVPPDTEDGRGCGPLPPAVTHELIHIGQGRAELIEPMAFPSPTLPNWKGHFGDEILAYSCQVGCGGCNGKPSWHRTRWMPQKCK